MSVEDRIAEVLCGYSLTAGSFVSGRYSPVAIRSDSEIAQFVARILAAELFPAIETVEQLDALPVGVIVKGTSVNAVCKHHDGWYGTAFAGHWTWDEDDLPVRVIWHPSQTS